MKKVEFPLFKHVLPSSDGSKGIISIALSQFGLAFSFNVVMAFMPFYIIKISPYKPPETMVWIGLIMGLNSFVAAAAAPFWGSLTAKFRPKTLFQGAFLFNGIIFLLMGFTDSLPMLLVLRLIQGALGGASTIGIFMILQLSLKDRLASNLSMYQNSMTAGQLLGPPVGAFAAAHIGYRFPFILSFLLVGVSLVLCHIYIVDIQKKESEPDRKINFNQGVLWGWALSFIATIHLTFLPSILPHVLEQFNLVGESALKSAGFIMMGYTATAIIGNYMISRLTARARLKRVIAILCLASAFFQLLLFFAGGVISFAAIRMLQTGVIAVVIPLVMASFASELGGTGIGFLNSARFAGNGVGPLMATFVLAGSNLLTLYSLIAALTVLFVLAFWITSGKRAS
ncbi:MAG: MFS transporter [Deltaproteobacteria bacterium]|nr:MFS transporter [Deltaproteobacteria bacterium]